MRQAARHWRDPLQGTYYLSMLEFTDETAPHQISFESYGTRMRMCANSAELLAQVEPFLPPGWERQEPDPEQHRMGILAEEDGSYTVFNGYQRVSERQGLELSLMVLDSKLRGYVALTAPNHVFIHAGAVAHEGRAMIFPGYSFAGKTTLVAALVRAGALYYSDEFAVLDAEGLVHPYPKPLSLRAADPTAGQADHLVEELGGVAGKEPVPLGLAAITYYRPGAEWNPKRISGGAAALALVSNAVTVRSRPDAAMRAITAALEDAITLEGERGEAEDMASRLLATVSA